MVRARCTNLGAVGKLLDIGFDDEVKEMRAVARIIDDHAWQKCMLGVYTGFSIGGTHVNAWKEGKYARLAFARACLLGAVWHILMYMPLLLLD